MFTIKLLEIMMSKIECAPFEDDAVQKNWCNHKSEKIFDKQSQ